MSSKRLVFCLTLAAAAALAAPTAQAIYLNTEAFRATGGDPNDVAATTEAGFEPRRQRTYAAPFDAVGLLPGCTGTVLGTDAQYAWVLTAAHCVGAGWRNYSITTPTISASGWSRVYYPPHYAGGIAWDIALVSIPLQLPASPKWNALTKAFLYDGNAEIGRPVHLMGHGLTGVAQSKAWTPNARLWGTSRITGSYANSTGLVAGYSARGATDLQVRAAPGDSGSATWQQHAGGYWTVVGVVSGGGDNGTNITRMNRHVEWIKGIYPGAATFSERFTVTESKPFVSRNHAEDVDHGTVYYLVAPNQSHAAGPKQRIWNGHWAHTAITVTAKDAVSGIERPIVLRATRWNGCRTLRMEDGVGCRNWRMGPLRVEYHAEDNVGLPGGEWKAQFDVEAVGYHRTYRETLPIKLDIRNLVQGRVQHDKAWLSPNFASAASHGTAYYLAPQQARASGPTSAVWGNGAVRYSTIHVLAREASTGFERQLVLRASRHDSCRWVRMEDGASCNYQRMGPLHVYYVAADNVDLPAGQWRGVAYIRAKGWHDRALDEAIRLDVAIDR